MTYRLGCALASQLAAIAPVAAWLPDCTPAVPVAVFHIHGLQDGVLPFDGGDGAPPVETGLAAWRSADGCTATPVSIRTGDVTDMAWAPCAAGSSVELVTIDTGRHEWPGATPKPGNDPVSNALDATTRIWAFFSAHRR